MPRKWTKDKILQLVYRNIDQHKSFFGCGCALCRASTKRYPNIDIYNPPGSLLGIDSCHCDYCPLWDVLSQPRDLKGTEGQCYEYRYKGRSLSTWDELLFPNKGALKAVATKILSG